MGSSTPTSQRGARLRTESRPDKRHALVVGGTADGLAILEEGLAASEIRAESVASSRELRDALFDHPPVLAFVWAVRDLPWGLATFQAIRKHPNGTDLPIVFVIDERSADAVPVEGVEDVLVTPFSAAEVALRLRVLASRTEKPEGPEVVRIGDVTIDVPGMSVRLKGAPVELTYKEFALLRYYVEHPGVALERARILESVWGEDYYGGDRTVDIHTRRIRAKLPPLAPCIETVHGVGYRFASFMPS